VSPQGVVRLYTRPGCHLCEAAHDVLTEALERYPLELSVLNVEDDEALEKRYGQDIPVVEVSTPLGEHTFRHRLDAGRLEAELHRLWNR
jgi:glutaredoxin